MLQYDPSPIRTLPARSGFLSDAPARASFTLSRLDRRSHLTLKLIWPEDIAFAPVPHLTRREAAAPANLFSLTQELFGWTTRSRAATTLEAGYGDIFCYRLPFLNEHNGTGWEEPSCGYLKINFTF